MFWGQDQTRKWHDAVFSTNARTEVVENLIALRHDLHVLCNTRRMALKPIECSPTVLPTVLKVEVHWIYSRRQASKKSDPPPVDLLQVPSLAIPGYKEGQYMVHNAETKKLIASGDVITMTTDDPVTLSLPSWDLLQMQWVLQRLSAISGAAEPQDNFSDDSSD